jgi:Protein of unknown function (DUF1517)
MESFGMMLQSFLLLSFIVTASSFLSHQSTTTWGGAAARRVASSPQTRIHDQRSTKLYIFDKKMFEEEGPLGKGITVGKVQVALNCPDRGPGSIFAMLEDNSRWIANDDDPGSLSDLAHEVCLSLLRKKESWTAACSASEWFGAADTGKAESKFNDWANAEAAKFEKVSC